MLDSELSRIVHTLNPLCSEVFLALFACDEAPFLFQVVAVDLCVNEVGPERPIVVNCNWIALQKLLCQLICLHEKPANDGLPHEHVIEIHFNL
jgi:hypothetical protein